MYNQICASIDFKYIQKIFETSKKLSAASVAPFVIASPAGFYTGHRSTSVFFPFPQNFLQGMIETTPVLMALKKLKKHKLQKITLAVEMKDGNTYLQILHKNAKMNFPMEGYVNSEDEKDNMPGSMFPELCKVLVKQKEIPFFTPPKFFWPALDAAAEYMVKSSDTSCYHPSRSIDVSEGKMASTDGYRGYMNKNFEDCADVTLHSYNLSFVKSLGMDRYYMEPVKIKGDVRTNVIWSNAEGVTMLCEEPINSWGGWARQLEGIINDAKFVHRVKFNQKEAIEALDLCSVNIPKKTKKYPNPHVTIKAQVQYACTSLSSTNGATSTEVKLSTDNPSPCTFGIKEEYMQDMMKKTAEFEVSNDSNMVRFSYHSGTVLVMCIKFLQEDE